METITDPKQRALIKGLVKQGGTDIGGGRVAFTGDAGGGTTINPDDSPFSGVKNLTAGQAAKLYGTKPSFYGPIQNPEDFAKFAQRELMKTKGSAQTVVGSPMVTDDVLFRLTAENLAKRKADALKAGATPEMGRPRLF